MKPGMPDILRRFAGRSAAKTRGLPSRPSFPPVLLAILLVLSGTATNVDSARAKEPQNTLPVERSEEPLFSLDSPIGPIEYQLGRGLRFGRTGLNIGGFATLEIEKERNENSRFSVEGINFLVLLQPIQPLRIFMELEVGKLYSVDMHTGAAESDATLNFQRLFGEIGLNDAFNVRLGKFQTPVGRWNLAPAEPFVWTATDPHILESFDEHTTGGVVHGSVFPSTGSFNYWLFGQVAAFDPEDDEEPVDHTAGGRLEYSADLGTWSVGSSLLASQLDQQWGYLAGLDGQFNYGPFELTSEFVYLWGDLEDPFRWDIYIQGVMEVLPNLYLVGRYEHTGGLAREPSLNLGDVGLTWRPVPFLDFKGTYRFSDERSDDVFEGFKASFTVLF